MGYGGLSDYISHVSRSLARILVEGVDAFAELFHVEGLGGGNLFDLLTLLLQKHHIEIVESLLLGLPCILSRRFTEACVITVIAITALPQIDYYIRSQTFLTDIGQVLLNRVFTDLLLWRRRYMLINHSRLQNRLLRRRNVVRLNIAIGRNVTRRGVQSGLLLHHDNVCVVSAHLELQLSEDPLTRVVLIAADGRIRLIVTLKVGFRRYNIIPNLECQLFIGKSGRWLNGGWDLS